MIWWLATLYPQSSYQFCANSQLRDDYADDRLIWRCVAVYHAYCPYDGVCNWVMASMYYVGFAVPDSAQLGQEVHGLGTMSAYYWRQETFLALLVPLAYLVASALK